MKKLIFLCVAVLAILVLTSGCVTTPSSDVFSTEDLSGNWTASDQTIYVNGTFQDPPKDKQFLLTITQDDRILSVDLGNNISSFPALSTGRNKTGFIGMDEKRFHIGTVISENQILLSSLGTNGFAASGVFERGEAKALEIPNIVKTVTTGKARIISSDGVVHEITDDFVFSILEEKGGVVTGKMSKGGNSTDFYGIVYAKDEEGSALVFGYAPALDVWMSFVVRDDIVVLRIFEEGRVIQSVYGISPSANSTPREFISLIGKWDVNESALITEQVPITHNGPIFDIIVQDKGLFYGTAHLGSDTPVDVFGAISPSNDIIMFAWKSNGNMEIFTGRAHEDTIYLSSAESGAVHSLKLDRETSGN